MSDRLDHSQPIVSSVRWRVVEAVITACEPLHQESLDALLGCTPDERKEAVEQLSSLFPTRDNKLYVYHKSVKDWLVDAQREDEMWYVDVPQVHASSEQTSPNTPIQASHLQPWSILNFRHMGSIGDPIGDPLREPIQQKKTGFGVWARLRAEHPRERLRKNSLGKRSMHDFRCWSEKKVGFNCLYN